MPELPDIEVFRQYFDATSLHQEIKDVSIRDDIVLKHLTTKRLQTELRGNSFESTHRHGKYLFTQIGDQWLAWHFGMTGHLQYFKDITDEPDYVPILISFANNYHLAYVMPRKLGRIELIGSIEEFLDNQKLGPDVLQSDFGLTVFKQAISGRHSMVKTTLMNQEIMAGIGNVYSDEILYQARIHPRTKINALAEDKLEQIYRTIKGVLQIAIDDYRANPERFPDSWLTPHRKDGEQCPNCDGQIKRTKISGRSARSNGQKSQDVRPTIVPAVKEKPGSNYLCI
jgi:formamidopyrimidine-DNA glycosylase